jgi:predicted metal-dependent phosphoesterase TrpH
MLCNKLGGLLHGVEQRGMMKTISKADLHIHTTYSDGTATVPEVLAQAVDAGLQLVAITDHDTIGGATEARRLARDFGIHVVVGEEVSTQEGHLLALFIEDELPPHRPVTETIAAVHAQGGLCIAAHPYDWASASLGQANRRAQGMSLSDDHPWHTWQVDALEVFNASLVWPRGACNLVAQQVAQALDIPAVGGSDAHTINTVGRGCTLFEGSTPDDLRRAIVHNAVSWGGECWSTAEYLELSWLAVRRRSLRGALAWACSDLPQVFQQSKRRIHQTAHTSGRQCVLDNTR